MSAKIGLNGTQMDEIETVGEVLLLKMRALSSL
jgi:hypothetical protein